MEFVTQQRIGPVHIDLTEAGREDLTVVDVPEDCVGFVMGKGGNTLRSMEEEWGTLMFFAQVTLRRLLHRKKRCRARPQESEGHGPRQTKRAPREDSRCLLDTPGAELPPPPARRP